MRAVVQETPGFEIVGAAASGEASLVLTEEIRPDLVLMDVHLPGIDGIEASRRLTRTGSGPVVVLLSTYDLAELSPSGCGAAAYLAKGEFGPDRLVQIWREVTG